MVLRSWIHILLQWLVGYPLLSFHTLTNSIFVWSSLHNMSPCAHFASSETWAPSSSMVAPRGSLLGRNIGVRVLMTDVRPSSATCTKGCYIGTMNLISICAAVWTAQCRAKCCRRLISSWNKIWRIFYFLSLAFVKSLDKLGLFHQSSAVTSI
jgi:hypothetical protein